MLFRRGAAPATRTVLSLPTTPRAVSGAAAAGRWWGATRGVAEVLPPPLREPSSHRRGPSAAPREAQSAAGAVGPLLRSGSTVFLHSAAATPTPLVLAMVEEVRGRGLAGITVCHMHVEGESPHQAEDMCGPGKPLRVVNLFTGASAREAVAAGRSEYVPIFLSEIPLLFRRGIQPVDLALISVSPPDRHGFVSLGPSCDITRAALQAARSIVAMEQRGPQFPPFYASVLPRQGAAEEAEGGTPTYGWEGSVR